MRRRRHGTTLALGLVAGASSVLAACDTNDGREMQPPSSYEQWVLQNTTPSTTTTSTTLAPVTAPPTTVTAVVTADSIAAESTTGEPAASSGGAPSGSAFDAIAASSDASPSSQPGGESSLPVDTFAESLGLANLADDGVEFGGPWPAESAIPVEYTCNGDETTPLLTWTAPPEGPVELALVVTDETADDFAHWIVIALPPEAGSVGGPEPVVVGEEATNSTGATGWAGPCPPDPAPHTYRFTLYALSQALELPPEAAPADLIQAIEASATGAVSFTGTYQDA